MQCHDDLALGTDLRRATRNGAPRLAGSRRILAYDPQGRLHSELAAFGPPPAVAVDAVRVLNLAGTGGSVTATLDTVMQLGGAAPQGLTSAATSTMTVLPDLAPLTSCQPFGAPPQLDAAGGDDFVASIGDECGATMVAWVEAARPDGGVEPGDARRRAWHCIR